MHELSITEKILDTVVAHARKHNVNKVISITLRIGDLSDLENEWMQHYFDYLSKNTVAAGAELRIERVPIVLKCRRCGRIMEIPKNQLGAVSCLGCGEDSDFSLESGREYYIKEMEAQ